MNNYLNGVDVCGAGLPDYGPPSPQQLMQANRPLTPAEQGLVNEWNKSHASFWQKEAFGGIKNWQAALGGVGLASILGGVVVLIVRKR